jgi:flagellar basal-body rod modification protein FlgD
MSTLTAIQNSLAAAPNPAPSPSASSSDALASEQTFLHLLVVQLQNQDPTQPQDASAFVAQLAQFSDLEQNVASRQDLDAIRQSLAAVSGSTPAA